MAKSKRLVPPDMIAVKAELMDIACGISGWRNYIADEELLADQNGEDERAKHLRRVEATWQELENMFWEVIGFIESKWEE